MKGATRWGYWQCKSCGKENSAKNMQCYSCGKARDKNTKFYPESRGDGKPGPKVGEDYKYSGPNWACKYCDSLNPASLTHCKTCGQARDGEDKDYFQLHPERKDRVLHDKDFQEGTDEESSSNIEQPRKNDDDSRITGTATSFLGGGSYHSNRRGSLNLMPLLKIAGIGLVVVLVVMLAIAIFAPKDRDLTILAKSWERSLRIEEYRTVSESGWSIPAGGRMTSSHQEIHHYDRVIDHYKDVEKTREVSAGGHYAFSGYIDNGDGTFTEDYEWVPEYKTEHYTVKEAVYVNVPVYQTKYVYDIDKWVFDYYEVTRGGDTEPYYAEVTLDDKHRINGRAESCFIEASYLSGEEEKIDTYTIDRQEWDSLHIGETIHAKVHFGNRVELIFDQ